ncbi:MAG TPA: hypothetical protein VIJ18_17020 [Microbacteriaceae bacterium]
MTGSLVYHMSDGKGLPRVEAATAAVTIPIGPVPSGVTISTRAFVDYR